jgi:thiol-disulfide isomerase/thioredoxin
VNDGHLNPCGPSGNIPTQRHAASTVVGGLIALVVVLAAASAAGWGMRMRNGRFKARGSRSGTALPGAGTDSVAAGSVLTEADLGASLGERATLVQFSTEFCAYCGPTREVLAEVARSRDGVALVEIDAGRRMDLARRLNVFSTPTVFVLAADGSIAQRASGQPRKANVLAAVNSVLGGGTP